MTWRIRSELKWFLWYRLQWLAKQAHRLSMGASRAASRLMEPRWH